MGRAGGSGPLCSAMAKLAGSLAQGEVEQPGIWLAEQVVLPKPFFERLATRGLVPTVEPSPAHPR